MPSLCLNFARGQAHYTSGLMLM